MQPDLRLWEFFVQMLVSAYFSWRWIGGENGQFQPWSLRYWECLARYSNLHELSARASLAAERVKKDGSYTIVASFRGAGAAERIKAAADSNRAEVAKIVRAELADILDNERNSIAFY
jgi:hypothetical protein